MDWIWGKQIWDEQLVSCRGSSQWPWEEVHTQFLGPGVGSLGFRSQPLTLLSLTIPSTLSWEIPFTSR